MKFTKKLNAIVCCDVDNGIGLNGQLLFNLKADKRQFRNRTLYKDVIMGRKTFESLPSGKPLDSRRNIVLTRDENYISEHSNVVIVHSVKECLDICGNNAYVIGGQEIYEAMLPYCNQVLVTVVHQSVEADKHFPDIESMDNWILIKNEYALEEDGVRFNYVAFSNIAVKKEVD